ncbi:hypothetical protein HFO61_30210 [Rhizobium leguminosarum]|uniref:hypothetical protein n=1 Tax=Rhizobium leguminosarum TaxID=384 RepID=UPI001C94ED95|nr:hypothetical protein [Rhizobium leguminosarum]MBY5551021.1 hypothetical protein [Rhizobium leguminosarum]
MKRDQEARAAAKQASRDEDTRRLGAGEVSQAEVKQENGFFSSLDKSKFTMVAIGGKPIKRDEAVFGVGT